MLKKNLLLSLLLLVSPVAFTGDSAEIKALKKDMPQDVALMIDRIIQCNHWNAAEPTNKEHAAQVKSIREKLRCDSVSQEHDALRKRYQNDYQVKARLQGAEQIFF